MIKSTIETILFICVEWNIAAKHLFSEFLNIIDVSLLQTRNCYSAHMRGTIALIQIMIKPLRVIILGGTCFSLMVSNNYYTWTHNYLLSFDMLVLLVIRDARIHCMGNKRMKISKDIGRIEWWTLTVL